ncbi:hypothetical protein AGABI1DRAFT_95917 [Agaricus bisporus var. burnettii JB137-S8]|uniref:Uncharacterized protein n=1 Tax=Agaricus bisporus var. burnettii (strain JB137-S8 / ATCC MYA-4627 / FGSC 10392) TaxID=597362 RepID=K5WTZ7_AGABU|nr:uncharacterized protein AGABI1DRAFT_95917 [Agaricus bisporus var. burnettii JB137-S8]EKM74032.1 hypothetical protein AGABI1DRAFT_95917 [Agaricus bisporus var. burnettii JB137-S8]
MSDSGDDAPVNGAQVGFQPPAYNAQHFPPNGAPLPGFGPAQFPGNPPPPNPAPNLNPPQNPPNPPPNPPNPLPNPPYVVQYNQPRHMPSRYDRNAPKFDGNPRSLKRFFEDIEVLARDCGITPGEQIAQTLRYLDGGDYEAWKSRPSAFGNDWNEFKQQVMDMYPGSEEDSLYSVTDLELFVERHASSPMRDQFQFGSYYRNFLTRAGWLLARGLISRRERNKLFMNGFHIDFRNQLRTQLRLQEPLHPLDEPWNLPSVEQAARFLIEGVNSGNIPAAPPSLVPVPNQYNTSSPPNPYNSSPRPTFDMSSIEQILMSDAFLSRLASRIPVSSPQQPTQPNSNNSRTNWPCAHVPKLPRS